MSQEYQLATVIIRYKGSHMNFVRRIRRSKQGHWRWFEENSREPDTPVPFLIRGSAILTVRNYTWRPVGSWDIAHGIAIINGEAVDRVLAEPNSTGRGIEGGEN